MASFARGEGKGVWLENGVKHRKVAVISIRIFSIIQASGSARRSPTPTTSRTTSCTCTRTTHISASTCGRSRVAPFLITLSSRTTLMRPRASLRYGWYSRTRSAPEEAFFLVRVAPDILPCQACVVVSAKSFAQHVLCLRRRRTTSSSRAPRR